MPRRQLLLACISIAALVAAGCADDNEADEGGNLPTTTVAPDTVDDGEESLDEGDVAFEASVEVTATPYSPIAAEVTVTANGPANVSITATSGDHVVRTPATAVGAEVQVVPLVGMRAERTYNLEVSVTFGGGVELDPLTDVFTTGALPYPLPEFDVTVDLERAQPGVTLIEYNPSEPPEDDDGGQMLLGLDHEGEVVFWYRNTGVIGAAQLTPDGTFLSHYFPIGIREFDLLGNVVGNWQVSPEHPESVPDAPPVELRDADALAALEDFFLGNDGDISSLPIKAEWVDLTSIHHEAYPMPNGNILSMSTTNHEISEEQREDFCPGDAVDFKITSDVLVEFEPDGRVVRTWDLWDVLDVNTIPGPALCSTDRLFESADFRDWTHANAVIYDENRDAIIISSRHTDQIIALDHLDGEGAQSSVRWIFGQNGTIPLTGDPMYHPHAVELQDDGSILLYDNGNFRPGTTPGDPVNPTYSRAVLYAVDDTSDDPADWSVTQTWEHRVDDVDGQPLYAFFIGDADRMDNGNVLINHGGIRMQDETDRATLIEVVPNGENSGDIVWELTLGVDTEPATIYRAERLPSLYFGPVWAS
jgi:hypothetical protein